ncbi:MAG: gamma carbonic anhydrase family protein [Deltaproteobacteria bacterium RBG_13_52_11]|nr:MAG: gamma carbonic anhydrase family protein [Deltaproteobacteria bacterium RBG_13_52_11]
MLYRFDKKEPVIGSGTYVSETALIIGDVKIGNNCYIGHGVILRGDYGTIVIGDESAVEEGVVIHAPPQECCSIGHRVVIGHGAIIHAKRIGDSAGIGMGAILSVWSEVARGSIVAEGAVVKREQKIPETIIVAGNPAKEIRAVSQQERDFWDWTNKIYIDLARKYCDLGMEKIDIP